MAAPAATARDAADGPAAAVPLPAALKEAGIAALVTVGLFGLLVGFETRQTLTNTIELNPRFALLGACVAYVFAGRLAISHAFRTPGVQVGLQSLIVAAMLFAGGLLLWGLGRAVAPSSAVGAFYHVTEFLRGSGEALWRYAAPAVAVIGGLLMLKRRLLPQRAAGAKPRAGSALVARMEANAGPVFLMLALAYPILSIMTTGGLQPSRYWVDVGILLLTYIMLGWGLNVVVGLAGLLDLGYVAFYAVGAYAYALIATTVVQLPGMAWLGPWMFFVCLPIAGLLAAFWGVLLGFPVLRLRGDYLAIVTLAFGEIIRLVLINWVQVTGGGAGISSIPRPTFFGIPFTAGDEGFAARFGIEFDPMHRVLFLYYIILVLSAVTYVVTLRLRRLPVGRAWEALREDEIACRSLGINTVNTKLTAFAIGAMFGGFAGCFFAARQGFISPESFTFMESAIILAIVVLGGMGSMLGVIIATLVLIGGPELLRNVEFLKAVFGEDFDPTKFRMILLGVGMVLIMIWKPRGLISTREPTAFLFQRKRVSGEHVKEGHG